jgi:hypothetical protein
MISIQCITEVAEATEIMLQTFLPMIATDPPHHITAMIHTAIIIIWDTTIDTRDGGAQVKVEDEVEVTMEEETISHMIEMITMKGTGSVDEEVDLRHRDVEIVVLAMTKIIIAVVGGVLDGMTLRLSAAAWALLHEDVAAPGVSGHPEVPAILGGVEILPIHEVVPEGEDEDIQVIVEIRDARAIHDQGRAIPLPGDQNQRNPLEGVAGIIILPMRSLGKIQ